jgi:hypothetical protein
LALDVTRAEVLLVGLDVVELIVSVEEHFGISISDAEAHNLRSVGDLHTYILAHAEPTPSSDASWAWLVDMIEADFGVPRERITPDAWVVRDLGIN